MTPGVTYTRQLLCTGSSSDGQELLTSGMTVCKIQHVGINIPFSSLQIETKKMNYIMAEQNDPALTDVVKMLEVEPAQPIEPPVGMLACPDIPALREQLAILVSTGKCKEAIGTQLTHDQVKRLSDKDVMRAHKRYEN